MESVFEEISVMPMD